MQSTVDFRTSDFHELKNKTTLQVLELLDRHFVSDKFYIDFRMNINKS